MKKSCIIIINIIVLFLVSSATYSKDIYSVGEFISHMQDAHGFDEEKLITLFDNATISESILEAIQRPAEKKLVWHQYRKIFIKKKRIEEGLKFWKNNESTLRRAEEKFGVPAEIIVAIIGVETFYGRISGSYRVIDALNTLAFHYPKRAPFFRSELEHFLLLTREQKFDPNNLKGSYAGAMGMPQFISSSYRHYAVDFDNDNVIDIWNNTDDVIGSVANYFSRHGWKSGKSIISKVTIEGERYEEILNNKLELNIKASDLKKYGIKTNLSFNSNERLKLFEYKLENSSEYWLAENNFYVITRYNHSKLYAMAVYQLALEVKKLKDNNVIH